MSSASLIAASVSSVTSRDPSGELARGLMHLVGAENTEDIFAALERKLSKRLVRSATGVPKRQVHPVRSIASDVTSGGTGEEVFQEVNGLDDDDIASLTSIDMGSDGAITEDDRDHLGDDDDIIVFFPEDDVLEVPEAFEEVVCDENDELPTR